MMDFNIHNTSSVFCSVSESQSFHELSGITAQAMVTMTASLCRRGDKDQSRVNPVTNIVHSDSSNV